jgi:hypothetical protein
MLRRLLSACALAGLPASVLHGQDAQDAHARTIRVPQGTATPVLLDGQRSAGEWDDARAIPIDGGVRLLVKQHGGHVYLAVATGTRVSRPVDVFLHDGDGRTQVLHASMQIGERALPDTLWTDTTPAWRWGNHVDWMANEAKPDAWQPRERPFSARLFPADLTEFQIRRSRFPGRTWRVRVEVGAFPGTEGEYRYPQRASRDPATWAVLQLD